ncbi:MAG: site-specific DNA-methyltransferase [Nanoarchaeota archaeon]
MSHKQKLELTWIGKNNPEYDIANIEPRILEEKLDLSYGDPNTENMIIHGDNLLALKALLPEYEGKVKCIYIDPPYNTGNAFKQYDDSVEHSTWLSLMKPRLELLRMLLKEDGVIFISIDDTNLSYLKILCDEVFQTRNFCGMFVWEKKRKPSFLNSQMGVITEFVLCFGKNKTAAPAFVSGKTSEEETYPLYNAGNSRGVLAFSPGSLLFLKHKDGIYEPREFKEDTSNVVLLDKLVVENGKNKNLICLEGEWRYGQKAIDEQIKSGEYFVVKTLKFRPRRVLLSQVGKAKKMHNLLSRAHYEMDTYEDSAAESIKLFGDNPFDYPKPEKLISTLISAIAQDGDLILDSFLGSGTTTAVAHKMAHKYIGIEMGEHAYSHVHKRMKKVVDGTDGLKLSETLGWKGGGGFKFYELAPSFVTIDEFGNPVIDSHYNDTKLIRAMCKLMNYTFSPSPSDYWKHGKGQGNNSIYVTTQMLSVAMVQQIASHLGANETLLICPKKYEPGCEKVDMRITIKKIPQSILKACQFGKKEYLLPIKERAIEEIDEEEIMEDDK